MSSSKRNRGIKASTKVHAIEDIYQDSGYGRPTDELFSAITAPNQISAHLIDIENLAGRGLLSIEDVTKVKFRYERSSIVSQGDFILLASGPQNKKAIYKAWPGAAYVWKKGKDGAELAILNLICNLNDLSCFERIYIGSGDGKLAQIADRSVLQGTPVTIVSNSRTTSGLYAVHHRIDLGK